MKAILAIILIVCAFPLTLGAKEGSYTETSVFTSYTNDSSVESYVETSGNAEVRIRTIVNGEVVEDIHLEGEDIIFVSEHEVVGTELLSSKPAIPSPDKTTDTEPKSSPEVTEQGVSDFFVERTSNKNLLFSFFRTDTLPETRESEEAWSASLISAISQFFTHFF